MAADANQVLEQGLPPDGTVVRARPLGWDERLTAEQEMDLEPLEGADSAGTLEGPIVVVRTNQAETGPIILVTVGGLEADPSTVEVVEDQT